MATGPLKAMLDDFVRGWERERPPNQSGRFGAGGSRTTVEFVSAVDWLADRTGISAEEIRNVRRARGRLTELRLADPLLAAIGRPDVLSAPTGAQPELPIQANPAATRRAQQACCGGGSLNGAANR